MRPLRGSQWCCALAVLALGSGTSQAAWDNVFQVCCHKCRQATANYAPVVAVPQACPQPCPQQQCTTRYEQRCYYQPVTTYEPYCYREAVTTYRTSYYWEPVCSYRYSCYFDPCTCSYRQVATPVTSYALRSQCCPVTSYLERTALKAVTTQQLVTYYQPITTCCTTQVGAPVHTLPPGATVVPGAGEQTLPGGGAAVPGGGVAVPGASDRTLPGGSDTSRKIGLPDPPPVMPRLNEGSSFKQPATPVPAGPSPTARLERIALLPEHEVEGQVLFTNSQPRAGARVLLVSKEQANLRETATADDKGQFRVRLTSGSWLVYLHDAEGTAVYQDVLEVGRESPRPFVLTSR
jgi:hypothetical protein